MKKTILISSGVVLVLLAIGVWIYLFVFGAPEGSRGIFSNFSGGGGNERIIADDASTTVDTAPVTEDGAPQALRQLTTRPVAGAAFTEEGIRYVEKGTGHIYEINLGSGRETLVSGTTIPRVVHAVFSPSGSRVALTTEDDRELTVIVGTISRNDSGEGVLDGITLPRGAREVAFSETGEEVFYLLDAETGAKGFIFRISEEVNRERFAIPLQHVSVAWGEPTHIYTKPSADAVGYVYRVGSELEYIMSGKPGLMATPYPDGIIVSHFENGDLRSVALDGDREYEIPLDVFPDKCAAATATSTFFCAAPLVLDTGTYPDDWYKGIVSLSDVLWEVRPELQEAALLSDFVAESGREIDVEGIAASADGALLWFINKNDNTLWMFDTRI